MAEITPTDVATNELIDIRIFSKGSTHTLIIDNRIAGLLCAIRDKGSLKQGALATGLAYNTAWLLLNGASNALGEPLLECWRGRGSVITPAGIRILDEYLKLRERVADAVSELIAP